MKKNLILSLISVIIISCENRDAGEEKIIYFPNSKIIKQSISYKNGKKNGSFKEFYRNGNLKAEQRYSNDTLRDTSFFYHENGSRSAIQIYNVHGKTGCWKKFNKEGKEYWKASFENNMFNGPAEEYSYRSLKLLLRKNYKNGSEDGKQEFFYPDGQKKSVCYFTEGLALMGTEEWTKSGEKINNDFKISISEKNEVLLNKSLKFYIQLENPHPDDKLYEISPNNEGGQISTIRRILKTGNSFVIDYYVGTGGFVMEEVHLAAYRTTAFGNTFIKKTKFMASANNF